MIYKYQMEQRVRVEFPDKTEVEGVVAHRRVLPGREKDGTKLKRYRILTDNDQAYTLIPEYWIKPVDQMELAT